MCVWIVCMHMDCKAASAESSSLKIFQAMAMSIQDSWVNCVRYSWRFAFQCHTTQRTGRQISSGNTIWLIDGALKICFTFKNGMCLLYSVGLIFQVIFFSFKKCDHYLYSVLFKQLKWCLISDRKCTNSLLQTVWLCVWLVSWINGYFCMF